VGIRSTAKPGRGGKDLHVSDFKHSRRVYATVSRESPNVIWLEEKLPSHPSVKAYVKRNKTEYPDQRFLDHGDTFDAFSVELELDKTRETEGFFASTCVPKKHGEVGTVYPMLLELGDIHQFVLNGASARHSLARMLCTCSRVRAHNRFHPAIGGSTCQ
jgi:hypothetical protein